MCDVRIGAKMHTMSDRGRKPSSQWLLGAELMAARKQAGFSQREASRQAGFSVTTWGQLETGRKKLGGDVVLVANPRPSIVVAAAKVVGLDPARALRLAGHDPAQYLSLADSSAPATVSQRHLAERFAVLDERQRRALLELIEAMLSGARVPVTHEAGPSDRADFVEGRVGEADFVESNPRGRAGRGR